MTLTPLTLPEYLAQLEECADLLCGTQECDDPEIESVKQRTLYVRRRKPGRKGPKPGR